MEILTIGLPVYNAERFLKDSIQSILNQSFTDFRLLIVDDGSTDQSIAIIKSFHDSRIELVVDGFNRGLPYRLNQIAALSKTKYLARMDSDDIMHPDKIGKQLEVLESNHEIDVIGTNAYSIDENNLIQGVRFKYDQKEILKQVKVFIHPTIMAKTEWFRNNLYDIKAIRIEDAELWFRTSGQFNFQILTQPLFFYREFGVGNYMKYFKGNAAILYSLKKHHWNISFIKFALKYCLSGILYFVFHLLGKEDVLVQKRNAIILSPLTIQEILFWKAY